MSENEKVTINKKNRLSLLRIAQESTDLAREILDWHNTSYDRLKETAIKALRKLETMGVKNL